VSLASGLLACLAITSSSTLLVEAVLAVGSLDQALAKTATPSPKLRIYLPTLDIRLL